jgi:hypothetical protein
MSSFYCEKCGKAIIDSHGGYTSGCKHYPRREQQKLFGLPEWLEQIFITIEKEQKCITKQKNGISSVQRKERQEA